MEGIDLDFVGQNIQAEAQEINQSIEQMQSDLIEALEVTQQMRGDEAEETAIDLQSRSTAEQLAQVSENVAKIAENAEILF